MEAELALEAVVRATPQISGIAEVIVVEVGLLVKEPAADRL